MCRFSNVAVTGGAGFIGSCLVRELLSRGYSVRVLDNFSSGRWKNLSGLLNNKKLEVVTGDIRDRSVVNKILENCAAVVHLAALIDVAASVKNPFETYDVNVNGTLNVLSTAVATGVKRFIFASSTAVYGDTNPLPLNENYPTRPISPYAASKAAAESYCLAFYRCYGIETVILRYFNVYGSMQRNSAYSGVITKFLENALNGTPLIIYGDGNQTRDFVYVDDVVDATVLALEKECLQGEIFNVCTGNKTSLNELVKILEKILLKDLKVFYDKPRIGDIKDNYGDPLRAQKILQFKTKFCLRKGLELIIDS